MIIALSGYAGSGKDTAATIIQNLTANGMYRRQDGLFRSPWQIKKFADPLRQVAAVLLGMPLDYLYTDEFKTSTLPIEWSLHEFWLKGFKDQKVVCSKEKYVELLTDEDYAVSRAAMTGRQFLQLLGTDAIRNRLHANAWVNALMSQYVPLNKEVKEHWRGHAINIGDETVEYPKWVITDMRFLNEMQAVKDRDGVTIRINRKAKSEGELLHKSETALDNAKFDFVIDNSGSIEDLAEQLKPILQQLNIIK
jgi:hypothetical protein